MSRTDPDEQQAGAPFWESLAELLGRPPAPPVPVQVVFGEVLRDGPAQVSPEDTPPAECTLTRWLDHLWDPVHPDSRSLRDSYARDEFAELEGMRITALLAIHEAEASPTHARAEQRRHLVYAWLRELMKRAEAAEDSYLIGYRLRDERTHPVGERDREDPWVRELRLLLFREGAGGPQLRLSFQRNYGELMLPVARWLLRRYEFRLASRLLRAGGRRRDRSRTRSILRLQSALLPRLLCSTLVGHFALATSSELFLVFRWTALQGAAGPAIAVAAFGAFLSLVWWELRQRAPLRPSRVAALSRIGRIGLLESVLFGLVSVRLGYFSVELVAEGAAAPFWSLPAPFPEFVTVLALQSTLALTLGYLLQILWDDKAISEPL